jgi:cytochrome c biogenesis protein CcmG/thiol:disulfide interchange protein DsbE
MENDISENQPPSPKKKTAWGRIIAWTALVIFLLMLAFGLFRSQEGPVGIGDKTPNFTLTTFDGEQIPLSSLRGKVVLINFWASWCSPCEQEAAELEKAWQAYQHSGKVIFLGVDYVDTEPEARAYLQKYDISYPNGPDLGTRISQAFRIRGVPETYIVDQTGIIQFVQIGPFRSSSQIQSVIDSLLQP